MKTYIHHQSHTLSSSQRLHLQRRENEIETVCQGSHEEALVITDNNAYPTAL